MAEIIGKGTQAPFLGLPSNHASLLSERIAKMLFTAPDGEQAVLLDWLDNGGGHIAAEGMSWAYVVENVRRILEEG